MDGNRPLVAAAPRAPESGVVTGFDSIAQVGERRAPPLEGFDRIGRPPVLAEDPLGAVRGDRVGTRLEVEDALAGGGVDGVGIVRYRVGQVDDRRSITDDREQLEGS